MLKRDIKRELRAFYHASAKQVAEVDVPAFSYLMIDGEWSGSYLGLFLSRALLRGPENHDFRVGDRLKVSRDIYRRDLVAALCHHWGAVPRSAKLAATSFCRQNFPPLPKLGARPQVAPSLCLLRYPCVRLLTARQVTCEAVLAT
jgi:hypothetical protein